jgi:hypothetical protein
MQNFKPYNNNEEWLNRKWRPMMAYTYMAICMFDFVVGPIINYYFFTKTSIPFVAWKTLTLGEGGLFHLAMGAILGVAAFTRGQEKVTRIERNNSPAPYDSNSNYRSRANDVIE